MRQGTKRAISWLTTLILLSMLCACSPFATGPSALAAQSNAAAPSDAPSAAFSEISDAAQGNDTAAASASENENADAQPPSAGADSALAAYRAVLQGEAEFYSADSREKTDLNGFLTGQELFAAVFKAAHFAILDLDGDEAPEVVIELTVGEYPEFYEALHIVDGEVYGYLFGVRALEALKADGTFGYSNGAADNGFGKLRFQADKSEMDIIGCQKPANGDGADQAFLIDDKPVSSAEYDSFVKAQDAKEDAVWHEFSQDSIDKELSANP